MYFFKRPARSQRLRAGLLKLGAGPEFLRLKPRAPALGLKRPKAGAGGRLLRPAFGRPPGPQAPGRRASARMPRAAPRGLIGVKRARLGQFARGAGKNQLFQ